MSSRLDIVAAIRRGAIPLLLLLGLALIVAACSSGGGGGSKKKKSDDGLSGFDDPLVKYQWFLVNTGQTAFSDTAGDSGEDINVGGTYDDGIDGQGVKVAVVDEGLEIGHDDLKSNVESGGSWDFVGLDTNPTNPSFEGDHGTSVGGLIGAAANSVGGIGVAPGATLVGYNFLLSQQAGEQVQALGGATGSPFDSSDVFVFNQSYGTSNTDEFLIDTAEEAQLVSGVTNLRGGKGALYVKSAGNGFGDFTDGSGGYCSLANELGVSCQNANMDASNAVPWNIVVGALNAFGLRSSYSTTGSAIWVSAPGGEYGYSVDSGWATSNPDETFEPAMVTTDQSGCSQGYSNDFTDPANEFQDGGSPNSNCDYTSTFNGTSSAAPVTAGAIALILDANSSLTWRDVKHILAKTAQKVDASQDGVMIDSSSGLISGTYQLEQGWITNDAGYHFHNWYGFGRVDVEAAVALAGSYDAGSLGSLSNTGFVSSGSITKSIPDGSPTGTTSTIAVSANKTIEAVQIAVSITHPYIIDLGIELTSPSGTKSILLNAFNGFVSADLAGMVLESNAFYGESSVGDWKIKVVDAYADGTGTLTNWQIRIYGH